MPDSFNNYPNFTFELRDDGLYQIDRRGKARWIGPPIEMIAFARTGESRDWGRVLRFTDRDGLNREHTFRERDVSKIGTLLEQLAGLGYKVPPDPKGRKALYDYIVRSDPEQRIRDVFRIGWQDGQYVLPDQVIGVGDEQLRLHQENADAAAKFDVRGTLKSWQQHVAPLCSTSSRLVLGICIGLAASLLDIAGIEGGGLHYVGPSSIGKTTILRGVASMMGGNEYVQSWSTTLAAAEETAMGHCDGLLCLDESKQLDVNPVDSARKRCSLVYMLANGEGRRRSISYRRQTGVGQYRWRVMVLSTGEESLEEHAEAGGLTRLPGETVRLIDVPADAGAGLGIYETLPDGLWCINGVGDGFRPLCLCSGDLPGDRHAEVGHAVDHRAGDPGLDLLGGQSPGPEAPADQNLVPVESGFNQGPLSVTDGFLPAHPAFPGKHLDVPVALSGLGLCGIAQNRV
jgi:putative DNA primase/helicase